jgi:hypothetical protein
MSIRKKLAGGIGLVTGLSAVSYPLVWRHRCLTWGATPDETARELPGDELQPSPGLVSTRAITINAPPSAIWPWLVQMGSGRGGAYTYDWIENLLGLDMHSADEILPQFQDVKVGDEFPLGRDQKMLVEVLDPERVFTVGFADRTWVWIFALFPQDGVTRLVSRNLITVPSTSAFSRLFVMLFMEPGSLVMERKMLLGIKERAERLARDRDRVRLTAGAWSG